MNTEFLLATGVAMALLLFVLSRTVWFRRARARWHMRWLGFRLAWATHRVRQDLENIDSPQSKLKRAREAVKVLRAGFWVNQFGNKIHSSPYQITSHLRHLTEAIEAGFSCEQIGTTKDEVVGFRNGEAHKTAARLELEVCRTLTTVVGRYRIVDLADEGKFALEDIGTSTEELERLAREWLRRIREDSVDHFREWATGVASYHEGTDEFVKDVSKDLSPEPEGHGFSYEDLRTSEEEFSKLIRLARRREVADQIERLKREAAAGNTENARARKLINEALAKAGLTLGDFGIAEADLDAIELSAHLAKARKLLRELKAPGEGWFYDPPPLTNPNIRFVRTVPSGYMPGDPRLFVDGIKENLLTAGAKLADIGTDELELRELVRAGHITSATYLLRKMERIAKTPRRTRLERIYGMLAPNTILLETPDNPELKQLEEPHPIEEDIRAIEYHLKGAGIGLEEVGSSKQKLQDLTAAIAAR